MASIATRHTAIGLLAIGSAVAMSAWAQEQRWQAVGPDAPKLSVTQTVGEPFATRGVLPEGPLANAEAPAARQTMVWAQRERVALGLGVEQRVQPDGSLPSRAGTPLLHDNGLVVGLALSAGPQTQVTLHTPLVYSTVRPFVPGDPLPGSDTRAVRMGLEFRTADRLKDIRRGALMRVELSNQSTVALTPRGGKIGLTYNKTW